MLKKYTAIVMALVMILVLVVPAYGQDTPIMRPLGEGTAEEPFLMRTAEHFRWMASLNHSGARNRYHYILLNDVVLDFSLGTFSGIFCGGGNTIYIENMQSSLIRYVRSTGVIANLNVVGEINAVGVRNADGIGGIIGGNHGTIINSAAHVDITTGMYPEDRVISSVNELRYLGNTIGGLVALNGGLIVNSYASGNIVGHSDVGGLVGSNSSGQIINSLASGNVLGDVREGALVGNNSGEGLGSFRGIVGRIHHSFATGEATWSGFEARQGDNMNVRLGTGGMVGQNNGIVGQEPLLWIVVGPPAPRNIFRIEFPELPPDIQAMNQLHNFTRRMGFDYDNLEEAFEAPLTDIELREIERFREFREWLNVREEEQEQQRQERANQSARVPYINTNWTFDPYDGWGASYTHLPITGDPIITGRSPIWMHQNNSQNNNSQGNVGDMIGDAGVGIIGNEADPWIPDSFVTAAINFALLSADWNIANSRHLRSNHYSGLLNSLIRDANNR
ncbi:MAG: hypothetical protein FWE05_01875 [Defluviitaleaceae bacterium]|nr:hypothetical protein [Defluviitaleaceae bacterium]